MSFPFRGETHELSFQPAISLAPPVQSRYNRSVRRRIRVPSPCAQCTGNLLFDNPKAQALRMTESRIGMHSITCMGIGAYLRYVKYVANLYKIANFAR